MARRPRTRVLPATLATRLVVKPYQGAVATTSTHTMPVPPRQQTAPRPLFRPSHVIDAPLVALQPPASASIAANVHVLIASVPWRRASLNRLLRDVAAQTLLPGSLHLVFDGTANPNAALDLSPIKRRGIKVTIREHAHARGAGARWESLSAMPDDHLVCNIDDDVGLYTNHYLQQHVSALQSADAVCSGGYTPQGQFIMCSHLGINYEGPINCLQAGAFSARVRVLRGLQAMPMAAELLGMLGDDEGAIAAFLWKKGVVVRRVNAPVAFDPCGSDPRSQFRSVPGRIRRLRTRLRQLTGWPWGGC